jgi:alkylation response protein AidB-like acyl-CoA dehydrogenase
LASVQTTALEEGDWFVINGQKVWTTGAHLADFCYLVVRTDPNAPKKHRGISELIVDMKSPGITVRPLIDITGAHDLNEVFFDNVHVPKKMLIGQKNRGWYQIASQLDYERSGIERVMSNYPLFMDIIKLAKEKGLGKDPLIRHKLTQLSIEFEVGRLLCYRVAWLLSQGIVPNYEAAMAKAFCTEFEQRLANVASQILGLYGQLMPGSEVSLLKGRVARAYLCSPAYTIQAGTSEILRNIVATRGLGLPS